MKISGLIFDLDNTLYKRSSPFIRAMSGLYPFISKQIDTEDFFRKFCAYGDAEYVLFAKGEETEEEMYLRRMIRSFRELGLNPTQEDAAAFQKRYVQEQHKITPSPGVPELFDWLKNEGIVTGIISNGSSSRQRMKIETLGMQHWIPNENVLISSDLNIHKPDPALFHEFAKRVKLPEESLWYVGDNYKTDIQGASSAGWHTIWLVKDKEEEKTVKENKTDYTVSNLHEVLKIVAEIHQHSI